MEEEYLSVKDFAAAAGVTTQYIYKILGTHLKPYKKKINILYVIAGIILIPLAAAFTFMTRKLSKMNTAVMQPGAANYMKPGSMNMDFSRDIFLYSTVSKREKPKESSTHTSSSGRTHGGRSGSF